MGAGYNVPAVAAASPPFASFLPGRARPWLTTLVLLATLAPLLWAAWYEHGVFWPDEVFQTLEQGHRFAFGYGLVPWEFRDGARSWLAPGAIGIVMKLGVLLGIRTGLGLARLVKTCFALGTACGAYATMRLAERQRGWLASVFAGAMYASCPVLVFFGSRCFTDTMSIPLVAFGTLLLTTPGDHPRLRRRLVAAGVLFGIATVVRYQNGLFVVAAVGVLAAERSWRLGLAFAAGAAGAVALGAALDWVTWGAPLLPLVRYAQVELSAGAKPGWFDEPATYYVSTYWHALGWPVVLLVVGAGAGAPRMRRVAVLAGFYFLVHSVIANKQARLLLPMIPLVIAMAGVGVVELADRATRKRGWVGVAAVLGLAFAAAATGFVKAANETFASLGRVGFGDLSAWHYSEDATMGLVLAGSRPDLCGVVFGGGDWGYVGVYSYLHRNVPLFHGIDAPGVASSNYIVAPRGTRVPFVYQQVDTHDTYALYRRNGTCAPPPADYSNISER